MRACYIEKRFDFVREAEKVNESFRFLLVIDGIFGEGCEVFAIERVRRFPSGDDDISFIELSVERIR